MVGAEVQQVQVAAQGDLARANRVRQPAPFGAVAQVAAAQAPDAGPQRVGRRQPAEIGHDHIYSGGAQSCEVGRFKTAVQGVERVGNQYHRHLGMLLARVDQGVGQFGRQWSIAVRAGKVVEQEHVDHQQLTGLADQREDMVHDLLPDLFVAVAVAPGLIKQQQGVVCRAQWGAGRQASGHRAPGGDQASDKDRGGEQQNAEAEQVCCEHGARRLWAGVQPAEAGWVMQWGAGRRLGSAAC